MMAGRIDDEKLYKRGPNHEPTKSVSTLIISFNWISPSFSDLIAIVLSHSRETLTLANNSSENLIFAKILLQNGALAIVKDQHGITPIEFAMYDKRLNAMKLMMFYQEIR